MKVTLPNGQNIHVFIKHDRIAPQQNDPYFVAENGNEVFVKSWARGTHAEIYNEDRTVVLGAGSSYCNPPDNFNRLRGLTLAMNRALEAAGMDRPARKCIYNHIRGQ